MKRVLFVDDESEVLDGLRRSTHHLRDQWEMAFAESGALALSLLETGPFDVIVSDLRMPQMDGAELLERVRTLYPGIIRIALSGCLEREAALRASGVVHQYLPKPWDLGQLIASIERFSHSTAILSDETARRIVGAIGRLPSLSQTAAALVTAIEKPETNFSEVAAIIGRDVSMAARVLQLVNSPLFALSCHVTSVPGALALIGLDTLKALVLSAEIFRSFEPARPIAGFSLAEFESHSALTAKIAARLPLPKSILPGTATAALLHDIGKLVLANRLPGQFERNLMSAHQQRLPLHMVEADSLGATHAEIGAYLLSLWGLSPLIVGAIWRHHCPGQAETIETGIQPAGILHIADGLAHDIAPVETEDGEVVDLLDMEYLARHGVAQQIPVWQSSLERI
jgi:HD-like signal output (HDOD) protein